MRFFRKRPPEPRQDGRSGDTAFRLPPVGSGSAISIEYKTLGKLFGREGEDWRIHDRIRSRSESGRQLEKFILGTRDGRQVVYFDITDVLTAKDSDEVQEVVDGVFRRQKDRFLSISLPKGAFLMLYQVMEQVGSEFSNKDFDPQEILTALFGIIQDRDIETTDTFDLSLSVANWVQVLSITGLVDVPSLRAQEFLSDLRGYIERALRQVGPG